MNDILEKRRRGAEEWAFAGGVTAMIVGTFKVGAVIFSAAYAGKWAPGHTVSLVEAAVILGLGFATSKHSIVAATLLVARSVVLLAIILFGATHLLDLAITFVLGGLYVGGLYGTIELYRVRKEAAAERGDLTEDTESEWRRSWLLGRVPRRLTVGTVLAFGIAYFMMCYSPPTTVTTPGGETYDVLGITHMNVLGEPPSSYLLLTYYAKADSEHLEALRQEAQDLFPVATQAAEQTGDSLLVVQHTWPLLTRFSTLRWSKKTRYYRTSTGEWVPTGSQTESDR